MSSTLQEHLEDAYEVDVEEQITNIAVAQSGGEIAGNRFVVDDEDKATWALRKIASIEKVWGDYAEAREREIERIEKWFEEVTVPLERHREFFAALLRGFHEQQLAADPSKKTIKLPAGTLKSIAGQIRWTIDEEPFLKWFDEDPDIAVNMPELVKVTRSPSKSAIKAAFEPRDDRAVDPVTGEVVPGVTVEPGQRSFKVEVAE